MKSNHNVNYTTHYDLCTGCGVCNPVCPKDAISVKVKEGNFRPEIDDNKCINCGLCVKVCPGVGINLNGMAVELYPQAVKEDRYIGRYNQCYVGHSSNSDLRKNASSGGTLSQFLIWLLETKKIDGALVTAFDSKSPLKTHSFLARTKEEILSAKGSKYAPVSLHDGIEELKKSINHKYVVVGLPCHIHGIRKQMTYDKRLRQNIIGLFSLFCSGTQSFNYTEYVIEQCGGNIRDLYYLAYREGCPTGMVADGKGFKFFKEYKKYNVPLKATFYPRRCLLCVDMFGELSDVAFGDIYVDNPEITGVGINAIIVRDKKWQSWLVESAEAGVINLAEISVDQMLYKRRMAIVKKERNSSFVALLKMLHMAYPQYDSDYNARVNLKIVLKYCFMRLKQFIGSKKILWPLLPKIQ